MRHLERVVERLAAEPFVSRTRSTVVLSAAGPTSRRPAGPGGLRRRRSSPSRRLDRAAVGDDHDRAVRVVQDRLARGPEQQPREPATTPGPDDDQVGGDGELGEQLGARAVERVPLHRQARDGRPAPGRRRRAAPRSTSRSTCSRSTAAGSQDEHARHRRRPGRRRRRSARHPHTSASAIAYRSAYSAAGDPSTPTTMRRSGLTAGIGDVVRKRLATLAQRNDDRRAVRVRGQRRRHRAEQPVREPAAAARPDDHGADRVRHLDQDARRVAGDHAGR